MFNKFATWNIFPTHQEIMQQTENKQWLYKIQTVSCTNYSSHKTETHQWSTKELTFQVTYPGIGAGNTTYRNLTKWMKYSNQQILCAVRILRNWQIFDSLEKGAKEKRTWQFNKQPCSSEIKGHSLGHKNNTLLYNEHCSPPSQYDCIWYALQAIQIQVSGINFPQNISFVHVIYPIPHLQWCQCRGDIPC